MLNKFNSIKLQEGVTMIEYALIAALNKFFFINSIKSQKGVTMIEYALIAALISVVAVLLLGSAGDEVKNIYTTIVNALTGASS